MINSEVTSAVFDFVSQVNRRQVLCYQLDTYIYMANSWRPCPKYPKNSLFTTFSPYKRVGKKEVMPFLI